jgi:hypothetical protein
LSNDWRCAARRIATIMESSMMTKTTDPTQDLRLTRREVFESKQAEHKRRFELREKMAAIIKREAAPLAIDARELESSTHIYILGTNGLPDIRLVLDGCGVHDADEHARLDDVEGAH